MNQLEVIAGMLALQEEDKGSALGGVPDQVQLQHPPTDDEYDRSAQAVLFGDEPMTFGVYSAGRGGPSKFRIARVSPAGIGVVASRIVSAPSKQSRVVTIQDDVVASLLERVQELEDQIKSRTAAERVPGVKKATDPLRAIETLARTLPTTVEAQATVDGLLRRARDKVERRVLLAAAVDDGNA